MDKYSFFDKRVDNVNSKENASGSRPKDNNRPRIGESFKWKLGEHCNIVQLANNFQRKAEIVCMADDFCTLIFIEFATRANVNLRELKGEEALEREMTNPERNILDHDMDDDTDDDMIGRVGDHVIITHLADNSHHEAKIVYRYEDFCSVKFLNFSLLKEVNRHDVKGKQAQKEQIMDENGDGTVSSNCSCKKEKKRHNVNQPQNNEFNEQNPAPRIPTNKHLVLPPPSMVPTNDPSVSAILSDWYMAGYYAGIHNGSRCCCNHYGQLARY